MTQKEQEDASKAFDECMFKIQAVFGRELHSVAIRTYYEVCQDWSAYKIRESFRRALAEEKRMPVPATIKDYGGGVYEVQHQTVDYPWPEFTAEQKEDLKTMRARFNSSKPNVPWADDPNSMAGMKL
jgi:hypothetical protein